MRLSDFRAAEGSRIPWWAGVVYRDFARAETVYAPLGLHLLFAMALQLWWTFRFAFVATHRVKQLEGEVAYQRSRACAAREDARNEGRTARDFARVFFAEAARAEKFRRYAMSWLALTHKLGIDPDEDREEAPVLAMGRSIARR